MIGSASLRFHVSYFFHSSIVTCTSLTSLWYSIPLSEPRVARAGTLRGSIKKAWCAWRFSRFQSIRASELIWKTWRAVSTFLGFRQSVPSTASISQPRISIFMIRMKLPELCRQFDITMTIAVALLTSKWVDLSNDRHSSVSLIHWVKFRKEAIVFVERIARML